MAPDRELPPAGSPGVPPALDRRRFLQLAGTGIVVFFSVGDWLAPAAEAQRREYPTDWNAYLRIGLDGRVTVFSGKIEMGQGVHTSLAQMAAEELGVAVETIDMVMGDTQSCPWDMGTFGSMSTRFFGPALRNAAAEARAILVELAAEQLKSPAAELEVENGVVFVARAPQRRLGFGRLAAGKPIQRHLGGKPALRRLAEFTVSGKPVRRRDGYAKVTGQAKYAGDLRWEGLLYARLLRPPAHDAERRSLDVSAAAALPGVIVVNQDGLVAALAADPEQAEKAIGLVRAEYDVPPPAVDTDSIFDHLVKVAPAPQEREKLGDLDAGAKASTALFEHRYENGYGAHAPMEPHTAIARFESGKVTVAAATQTPFPNQAAIAEALGIAPENVRVITPFVGGGFGGKSGGGRQSIEAAKLARIVGRPVQVAWTRAEEFFYDAFRPAAVVAIRSGIDGAGRMALWDYQVWFAGTRSAERFYDVPNHLVRAYGQWGRDPGQAHPFATGPWRAPGANINVFARESQIDIMAARAGIDPLEFRLRNTTDPRMRGVLEEVAARAGWTKGAGGRGRGLACGIDAGTYVALVAGVEVDRATGRVRVKRVVCAQEMGQVINPEGARMQMEGCITMGLGYALSEELRFRGRAVLERNFDTYQLPRFSDVPRIETYLVKNDALEPQGGGEPAIVPMGAAIANAIADATGARLFRMPMTPERVRRAIAG